jgi:squalene-hopene/tetraprenyl-beta-curcumene cyclase
MHLTAFGRISLLAALAVTFTTAPARAGDEPAGWKKEEAAKYMDERAKTWFAFGGAGRGEGETKVSCVSCHTLLPYALGRPALRKLTGAGQPTEYEKKVLAQVKMRVERWGEIDSPKLRLFYDFNEDKKKESWGTEAILNAVLFAFDDRYEGRKAPSDTTKRAFANLWQVQLTDGDQRGTWDWLNFGLEPWESGGARYFGAALAAVAVGTAPGYYTPGADADLDKKVQLLRDYLKDHRAGQNLFNRAWLLWASAGLDGLLTPEERKTLIGDLLEAQQDDGGWRLASLGAYVRGDGAPQDTTSDGYATGLVLHVVQTAGVPKDGPKVAKGLSWLRTNQGPTGAWPGSSVNKKRDPTTHVGQFMSDAGTAYAILALSH